MEIEMPILIIYEIAKIALKENISSKMTITQLQMFCEGYVNQNPWGVAKIVNIATRNQNITFGNIIELLNISNVGISNNAISEMKTTLFYKVSPIDLKFLPVPHYGN